MKHILVICLIAGAGDLSAQSIPEPLVFDLVLALGAQYTLGGAFGGRFIHASADRRISQLALW